MKPIDLGMIKFSEKKQKFQLSLQGSNHKFSSLKEAAEHANEELLNIAKKVNKPLTIRIFDKDKSLTSNLVVKRDGDEWTSEIISSTLFMLENKRYYNIHQIESHLPIRRIDPNELARVNLVKSKRFRKEFLSLFALIIISSALLLIFSVIKVQGVGLDKIDVLKKLMHGEEDRDVFNTWIAISAFCIAVFMFAYSAFIFFKGKEIRKFGTFNNHKWSRLYINNEIRKELSIFALSCLLGVSILQTIFIHESYVYSVRDDWWVAMAVIVVSYFQIFVVAALISHMIFEYVESKYRFRKRLKVFFNMHYYEFLKIVREEGGAMMNADLSEHKDVHLEIEGIRTRTPQDERLTGIRIYGLSSPEERFKLWFAEKAVRKEIKNTFDKKEVI